MKVTLTVVLDVERVEGGDPPTEVARANALEALRHVLRRGQDDGFTYAGEAILSITVAEVRL